MKRWATGIRARLLRASALGFAAIGLITVPAASAQQQMADPAFRPQVRSPAYSSNGPKVVIDEAHFNLHSAGGGYGPFAELIRADGYEVGPATSIFSADGLVGVDILVVANAGAAPASEGPVFNDAEIAAVEQWVDAGGRLLLIADHAPYGSAAEPLARAFGVRMGKGYAFDFDSRGVRTNLVYPPAALGEHPIIKGREPLERVQSVTAFTGQSLSGPADAAVLLPLTVGAREAPDLPTLERINDRIAAGESSQAVVTALSVAALPAQALAFTHGRGRVVVLGEAGMLTAQVVRIVGEPEIRFGMNVAPGNAQFALNIMRWLSGLLPVEPKVGNSD